MDGQVLPGYGQSSPRLLMSDWLLEAVLFSLACSCAFISALGCVEVIADRQVDIPSMIVDIGLRSDIAAVYVCMIKHAIKNVVCT